MEQILVTNKFFNLPETGSLWTAGHIVQIVLMVALLVSCWFLFRKKASWQNAVYWILFAVAFVTTANMLGFSIVTGIYNPEWYMPFHICNLFLFVIFLMAVFKGKVRSFLSDYAFYFGILGCVFAIVLPATTQLYFPAFHIISFNTWVYHLVIGTLSVYMLSSGVYKIRFSNLWRMLAVFIPLIITAFIFNSLWDTNFCFMNPEKFYYPLNLVANFFGKYWTLLVVVAIVDVSIVLMAASLVVLTIKDWLISKLIVNNPILVFIKEQGLFDNGIAILKTIFENEKIKSYVVKTKTVLDEAKILACYDAVKDDIKNMTVGQLEDITYIMKLLIKSDIINVLLKQFKIIELKKYVDLVKQLPYNDILNELKLNYTVTYA